MIIWTVTYEDSENVDEFGARVFLTESEAYAWSDQWNDSAEHGRYSLVESHEINI